VLQVFCVQLRLDLFVGVVLLGRGVEPEALHPLALDLELQAPHILPAGVRVAATRVRSAA
jgi:hypothetical protein